MTVLWWTLAGLGGALLFLVLQSVHLAWVLRWEDEQSVGLGYYGLPPAGRRRFKALLRLHAILLAPILQLNARLAKFDFRKVCFVYRDVPGPLSSCSPESFASATSYQPRPGDVFVVTQMKCGTTWMQHLVYQVLLRGNGTLVESGTALYAVAPWLEGRKSVPVEDAPVVGRERPARIIKTHLPAQLCPVSAEARYIYVARHPVSCFASCIDFVATNVGGMAPAVAAFEEWYTAPDLMWWGTWPGHVEGWWARAAEQPNVLFIHFEEMKRDLPVVARRVAAFLDLAPLRDDELAAVVAKCGFDYMQEHQDSFEMHPPHILQTEAELFVRGSADRHLDVPAETRDRILAWAAAGMTGSGYPLAASYPDVAAAGASPGTG